MNRMQKLFALCALTVSVASVSAESAQAWKCDEAQCTKTHVAVPNQEVGEIMVKFVEEAHRTGVHTKLPKFLVTTYLRMKNGMKVHAEEWKDSAEFLREVMKARTKK